MANFDDLTRPDLSDLSGFGDVSGTGFQGAHVHGKKTLAPDLDWLFEHMNSDLPVTEHLDANSTSNGVLLPGSNKANTSHASSILGVADGVDGSCSHQRRNASYCSCHGQQTNGATPC
ncbi:hypothetical protein, partial [Pseudovibrio sp. POLY-S9]|uniref:hypothetical protein n=1 Tax=Pseudovibrio sp. POLY-S9 TaxID=1576596 RepID=UPI000B1C0309